MAQDFDKRPQVIFIDPKNRSIDIPTTITAVTLGFNIDLDINHLENNFRIQDRDGRILPIIVTYENRIATLSLLEQLSPSTTYQVLVFGDSNIQDTIVTGIRNIFGTPMSGIYEATFVTVADNTLPAPEVIYPKPQTVIKAKPVFQWGTVTDATHYEVQLAVSNQMNPAIWPSPGVVYDVTTVEPEIEMKDGIYYWRVRGLRADGTKGEWTDTVSFNLSVNEPGTVSDEDTLPPEESGLFYDPFIDSIDSEVIATFPKENATNMKNTLKTIYIHVMGAVTLADVSVSMFGESVTGDEEDHGEVTGTIEVFPQTDGTTIIAFQPNPIIA